MRRLVACGVAMMLSVLPALSSSGQAAKAGTSFTTFQLETATIGESCPSTTSPCINYAVEPQIRTDPSGTFYGVSADGLGGGTEAWKSTDGGQHYTYLGKPDALSYTNNTPFAPGGGDTDIAVAPAKNRAGNYNVYVASLSGAQVDVSTSADGGATWTLNPTSATIPGDDREWIAADGLSKVCISYHDVTVSNINVDCSLDAGATFSQHGSAIDANHLYLLNNNMIGNLAIDPSSHIVYQTFSGIADVSEQACGTAGTCGYHVVYMAVSMDGGKTFTDYPVYNNPTNTVSYGHQFVNVSVDRGGNVYSVYSDDHNVYYSFSVDHGQTWSGPYQINAAPSNTAIMPWSTAGRPGRLDVVWYGTPYYDGTNTPQTYPSTAAWQVYFAQNLTAITPGTSFTQTQATGDIHYGDVCEQGVGCLTGNRDLYDDFGVAANPKTGLASIFYSDDQYDPAQPTRCTPDYSNTAICQHTNAATQVSGPGI